MKNFILIFVSLFLITSCDKNNDLIDSDLDSANPEISKNDSLDVNSDHIFDFVIGYKEVATYDLPSSGGSIIGSISPLNQNQLLYRNSVGYLFLDINDTIRKVSNSKSDWNEFSADLVSIDRKYQNWDKTWTVISEKTDFYFLAYKLVLNDSEKIGWISIDIDSIKGKIFITDGDYSDDNELIINKKTID